MPPKHGEQTSMFVGHCSVQLPTPTERFSGLLSVWFQLTLFELFMSQHCWDSCLGTRRWDNSFHQPLLSLSEQEVHGGTNLNQPLETVPLMLEILDAPPLLSSRKKHCDIQGMHFYACKIFSIVFSPDYKCQANYNNTSTAFRYWSLNLPCEENNNHCKEYRRLQL